MPTNISFTLAWTSRYKTDKTFYIYIFIFARVSPELISRGPPCNAQWDYCSFFFIPRQPFTTRRATWQDARRHGVIKVPLSMGNCNPPISLTLPPVLEEGRICIFVQTTTLDIPQYIFSSSLSFDVSFATLAEGDLGWSLCKPPHLRAPIVCNTSYDGGIDEWHVVRMESTAEKWPPLVAESSTVILYWGDQPFKSP